MASTETPTTWDPTTFRTELEEYAAGKEKEAEGLRAQLEQIEEEARRIRQALKELGDG